MKQKRAKSYRKQMAYYHMYFKFREPYQVLVDEEIVLEATKTKYDLVGGLKRTLQGEVKPMITQCAVEHLYRTKDQEAIDLAKSFERRRCGHYVGKKKSDEKEEKKLKSSFECMNEVVLVGGENKHRYVVATQKPKLRALFRKAPAIPLIYMNRSVMIMEPMSPMTERKRNEVEKSKLSQGLNDPRALKNEPEPDPDSETKAKKRKIKEPNPLSVKKKKTEPVEVNIIAPAKPEKKRRRKHHRGVRPKDGGGGDDSGVDGGDENSIDMGIPENETEN